MLALVAFGIVDGRDAPRDAVPGLGIVLVENGLALAALELPGGASLAIELGVALDLMLVALVAASSTSGSSPSSAPATARALRSLRD